MKTSDTGRTAWAFWLILALPFVTVLSTTLTAAVEVALYLLFMATPELRTRFVRSLSQPMVLWGLCLYGLIIVSSVWSSADWHDKLEAIKSCRKILVLPMVVSVINVAWWKDRFLLVFIACVAVTGVLSWLSWVSGVVLYEPAHELLGNDTTQGMAFFVAAFAAAGMVAYHKGLSRRVKTMLALCVLVLLSNNIVIGESRSGYLLGLVLAGCFGLYARGARALVFAPLLVVITAGLFYLSPTPYEGIITGWTNMVNAEQADDNTSAGLRVVFWKNTLPVLQDAPFIGHGLRGFKAAYAKQVAGVEGWRGIVTGDPHNQYLFMLAEQGALGLLALFAFLISCCVQKTDSLYRFMGLSVLLGWMATSFFNGHFSSSAAGRFIVLWCGGMLSMPLTSDAPRWFAKISGPDREV